MKKKMNKKCVVPKGLEMKNDKSKNFGGKIGKLTTLSSRCEIVLKFDLIIHVLLLVSDLTLPFHGSGTRQAPSPPQTEIYSSVEICMHRR